MPQSAGLDRTAIGSEFDELEKWIVREKGYGSENYVYILKILFDKYLKNINGKLYLDKFNKLVYDFEQHSREKPLILEGVANVLKLLSDKYNLYVLTKGNIEEQKRKIKLSELSPLFKKSFVVEEKNISTYQKITQEEKWKYHEYCMIGNSPKSDINPALKTGMFAIFIPYEYTWKLDNEPVMKDHPNLKTIDNFKEIPEAIINF